MSGWSDQTRAEYDGAYFKIFGSPAAAPLDSKNVFVAWRDGSKDSIRISYSVYIIDTNKWGKSKLAGFKDGTGNEVPFNTKQSPCVACIDTGKVFLAWNGSGNDGIWYSFYNFANDVWANQKNIKVNGKAPDISGALAAVYVPPKDGEGRPIKGVGDNGAVIIAYIGNNNQYPGIKYVIGTLNSERDGIDVWSEPAMAQDVDGTIFGTVQAAGITLALTTVDGQVAVAMAWDGSGNNGIWFSQYVINSNAWTPQYNIKAVNSSSKKYPYGPGLVAYDSVADGESLMLAWAYRDDGQANFFKDVPPLVASARAQGWTLGGTNYALTAPDGSTVFAFWNGVADNGFWYASYSS